MNKTECQLIEYKESWGRGYKKISKEFTAAQMELPTTESAFGGVLVTIKRGQVRGQVDDSTEQVGVQVDDSAVQVTEQVIVVLELLENEERSIKRMMLEKDFKSRDKFIENYLNPCTMAGWVAMTQPDSPKSPTQKYKLTEKGRVLLGKLKISRNRR